VVGTALLGLPLGAMAQEEGGTKTARELRADYDTNVKNKAVAFLPIALGVPLQDEWNCVLKMEADWRGMKYVVRDPNNNPAAMQHALTALVNDKPDVLIVQNPSVTLLMKELKRAESQGTHVIQINMSSNYKSDAFVGADWVEVGRMIAEDMDTQCGTGSGKSGKDRPGRARRGGQRRSDRQNHGGLQQGQGDQSRLKPGGCLGCQQRAQHHVDGDPAAP
jgi:ribose transport system substrate-binding protein